MHVLKFKDDVKEFSPKWFQIVDWIRGTREQDLIRSYEKPIQMKLRYNYGGNVIEYMSFEFEEDYNLFRLCFSDIKFV